MGRKSRYSEYARGMSKRTVAKNATTTKSKSIKNKLQELKEKPQKRKADHQSGMEGNCSYKEF